MAAVGPAAAVAEGRQSSALYHGLEALTSLLDGFQLEWWVGLKGYKWWMSGGWIYDVKWLIIGVRWILMLRG